MKATGVLFSLFLTVGLLTHAKEIEGDLKVNQSVPFYGSFTVVDSHHIEAGQTSLFFEVGHEAFRDEEKLIVDLCKLTFPARTFRRIIRSGQPFRFSAATQIVKSKMDLEDLQFALRSMGLDPETVAKVSSLEEALEILKQMGVELQPQDLPQNFYYIELSEKGPWMEYSLRCMTSKPIANIGEFLDRAENFHGENFKFDRSFP